MLKPNYFIIPLVTIITAMAGSLITGQSMGWYETIAKPTWTPDGSVIGAVWTILFILATISALIFWNKTLRDEKTFKLIAYSFVLNAVLNIFWSYLFFGQHLIGWAIGEAVLLALSVLWLVYLLWSKSKIASSLLIPYFLWTSFATFLTYSVWILN